MKPKGLKRSAEEKREEEKGDNRQKVTFELSGNPVEDVAKLFASAQHLMQSDPDEALLLIKAAIHEAEALARTSETLEAEFYLTFGLSLLLMAEFKKEFPELVQDNQDEYEEFLEAGVETLKEGFEIASGETKESIACGIVQGLCNLADCKENADELMEETKSYVEVLSEEIRITAIDFIAQHAEEREDEEGRMRWNEYASNEYNKLQNGQRGVAACSMSMATYYIGVMADGEDDLDNDLITKTEQWLNQSIQIYDELCADENPHVLSAAGEAHINYGSFLELMETDGAEEEYDRGCDLISKAREMDSNSVPDHAFALLKDIKREE